MLSSPIIKIGNTQLSTPSLPIKDFATPELYDLIQTMKDTMHEKNGVGIAAPQIGYNLRVILIGFDHNIRYPDEKPIPFTVLINPEIERLSDEMVDGWEGCLSIPQFRGLVPRFKKIKYYGYDAEGDLVSDVAVGFHARVIQHEMDHINGILYPERIRDMRCFGFEEELKDIIWPPK